jgi:hypothetical protein
MAAQSEALGHQITEISSIETGAKIPSESYISELADWLGLNPQQQLELRKSVPRNANIIAFPRRKEATKSVRLFRKIGQMTPDQIRALTFEGKKGAPYE